jgi:iron(III) transport system substrate-binding protein
MMLQKFIRIIAVSSILVLAAQAQAAAREVVIYTSVDQVFSEPVLKGFEEETGIRVKPLYDVEASKTTGLVNRLIAEKSNPKCDVFWNSEFAQTIVLQQKEVLAPYQSPSALSIPPHFKDTQGYWTGFAARARVLIYNTRLLKDSEVPQSIFDFTDAKWRGKFTLAYPLFGTTRTHVAAWYAVLGKKKTEEYLQALKANHVVIVDGNSVARDIVVEGEVPIGFTDTDDVNVAVQSGKPVKMLFPDKDGIGTLLIPNTVALVRGCPHPEEAKALIDYLLSRKVESLLAFSESAQIPVRDGVEKPLHVPEISSIKVMAVDYGEVAGHMNAAAEFCQGLFVR